MGGTVSTRIVGKPKQPADTQALDALDKIKESVEMLDKKEKLLEKKANAELERAKEFTKLKNKKAAMQCLKMRKMYENQIAQMGNYKMRLYDQMFMVENAKATTETLGALKVGAETMKAMQKATKIDDIEMTLEDINEQNETMRQIQDSLSVPIGMTAEIDDEDLLEELNDMEQQELQEELEVDLLRTGPPSRIEPYVRASNRPGPPLIAEPYVRQSNPQYQKEESGGKQPLAVMAEGVTFQTVREGRKQPMADQMVGEKIFHLVQEGLPQADGSAGKQPVVEELRHQKPVADGGLGEYFSQPPASTSSGWPRPQISPGNQFWTAMQAQYPKDGEQPVHSAPRTEFERAEGINKRKEEMKSTAPQKSIPDDHEIEKLKAEMLLDQGSYPPYGKQAVQPEPQTTSQREDSNKLKEKMQSKPQQALSEDEQIEKIKKEMQLAA